jgi:hypothetical protein
MTNSYRAFLCWTLYLILYFSMLLFWLPSLGYYKTLLNT